MTGPLGFRRAHRVRSGRDFDRAMRDGVRDRAGPLGLRLVGNELDVTRLGLAVSRRVGPAVRRNAVKRRLREAFRHLRPAWPTGFDLVVVVDPHRSLRMQDYRDLLARAMPRLVERWARRAERAAPSGDAP